MALTLATDLGLSPLARGNRGRARARTLLPRSIPARAGEPRRYEGRGSQRGVYPRSRGGTGFRVLQRPPAPGLSPLARGNRSAVSAHQHRRRSIPARAGEPRPRRPCQSQYRVYPRSRGGTSLLRDGGSLVAGLSPLARGNLSTVVRGGAEARSIPARAGEPASLRTSYDTTEVYPRSRGGTASTSWLGRAGSGLSPLARGNRRRVDEHRDGQRSIPARAGEPNSVNHLTGLFGVYPRSRGGTAVSAGIILEAIGLSPLARGNPTNVLLRECRKGSIPARAGEPRSRARFPGARWVYPRSRGGTSDLHRRQGRELGLSPLARGNPVNVQRDVRGDGSIPARAGEPTPDSASKKPPWVYPRSRGGTAQAREARVPFFGLSPLARGNRVCRAVPIDGAGSIPARAGEPRGDGRLLHRGKVYPRSRGGTHWVVPALRHRKGLSPLARGNRELLRWTLRMGGSIPARAGEPGSSLSRLPAGTVYPRSRGGTA